MTLATEHEIILGSSLDYQFAPSSVANNLKRKEQSCCLSAFGWDFYQVLLADKVVYSSYEEYDSDTTYADGDHALWNGRIYESLIDANINNPINDSDSWALAPKFTTTLYNTLWNEYLLELIAHHVAKDSVVFSTFKASRGGLVKFSDINTGAQAGSRTDVDLWMRTVRGNIEEVERLMIRWINEEIDKTTYAQEFDEITWVNSTTSESCDSARRGTIIGNRRIYFRNGWSR